jgi:hypothetical protein
MVLRGILDRISALVAAAAAAAVVYVDGVRLCL